MKKSKGSAGVIAMMDLLVADLDKQTTGAETDEKNAAEEYQQAMEDAAAKRTQDSKSLTDKEATKAERKAAGKELRGTIKYISTLKAECDWLLQYFDVRKSARADEVDSLQRAKAVLSGADYSLVQQTKSVWTSKFLHRA